MSPSLEIVHDSASPGTIWVDSSAKATRVSTTRRPTRLELRSVTWAGSSATGSATSPTTSVLADWASSVGVPAVSTTSSARARPDQIRLRLIVMSSSSHGLPGNRSPGWRPERAEYSTARRGLDIAPPPHLG